MKFMLFFTVLIMVGSSHADTNLFRGWECSGDDNSTITTSFQTNLNTLLNSLATNAAINNGFYKNTVGKNSNSLYGLVQCRGDISPNDCGNCTQASISEALSKVGCPKSTDVTIWFSWCTLRYSNKTFFGNWHSGSMEIDDGSGFDGPYAASKGLAMMSGLASTVPNYQLMFQTGVVDVGQGGKRYGLAQCNRDLSKSDCGKCLDEQLVSFGTTIQNKRGWEINGVGCRMWYHDYQFYFNISTTATSGTERIFQGGAMVGIASLTLLPFLLV